MGRRSGIIGVLNAVARETARQQRRAQQARIQQQREVVWQQKQELKDYYEEQKQLVEQKNLEIADQLTQLESLLEHTLSIDDKISFNSLRIHGHSPTLESGRRKRVPYLEPKPTDFTRDAVEPKGLAKLVPGARKNFESKLAAANVAYVQAHSEWAKAMQNFMDEKRERNNAVDEFEKAFFKGDGAAIETYCGMVLDRSVYPTGFPQKFELSFIPESGQLVIEYEMPTAEIVPAVAEFKYTKSRDEIAEKARKSSDIKDAYQDVVSSIALRTIHEIFEAEYSGFVSTVCFNGFVCTVDPATGRDIRPHLISVRTTRERFQEIDLSRVDTRACLRNLGAQVSARPNEAQPVKPIVEFDMVDPRFVDRAEILITLESRPNLMELNPYEFENLVTDLFAKMGLEAKLTRSSKDGGVDCVAYDSRPVLGGRVVIQAKRYKNTVGVSAVRDLYGTMMNEGANKGILVTTSGYGPDAFDFVKDKPIELIDGSNLLYLLSQVGFDARIVIPQDT